MSCTKSVAAVFSRANLLLSYRSDSAGNPTDATGLLSYLTGAHGVRLLLSSKAFACTLPRQTMTAWRKSCARLALSGSHDATLCLWDLEEGKLVHRLEGHSLAVLCVCANWNLKLAVSGSQDYTMRLWDLEKAIPLRVIRCSGMVECVAVNWSSRRAIACCGHTLTIWDLNKGVALRVLQSHSHIHCMTPDLGFEFAVLGCGDCQRNNGFPQNTSLAFWNLSRGRILRNLQQFSEVCCVAVDWASWHACTGDKEGLVILWDLRWVSSLRTCGRHEHRVTCMHVDWALQRVLSGSRDQTMCLWDLQRGTALRKWEDCGVLLCMAMKTHRAQSVLVGTAGERGRRGIVKLQDLKRGKTIWEFTRHRAEVLCLAAKLE